MKNFQGPSQNDFYKPHDSVELSDWGPSLTRQEFAEECDINVIMSRYENGSLAPFNAPREPMYLDLTVMPRDLMSALDVMTQAENAFMSLPALVRREFENDPVQFVAFASDPDNLSQMQTWGLAPPAPVEPGPIRVIVDPPIVPAPQEPSKAP